MRLYYAFCTYIIMCPLQGAIIFGQAGLVKLRSVTKITTIIA